MAAGATATAAMTRERYSAKGGEGVWLGVRGVGVRGGARANVASGWEAVVTRSPVPLTLHPDPRPNSSQARLQVGGAQRERAGRCGRSTAEPYLVRARVRVRVGLALGLGLGLGLGFGLGFGFGLGLGFGFAEVVEGEHRG